MSRILSVAYSREISASESRTERGLERMLGFTDAVVAIAITLIVLPLVDVVGEPDVTPASLLSEDGYRLGSAVVTFLVIASLWRQHHTLFERASTYTHRLMSATILWIAAVVALPVPTALLFAPHDRSQSGMVVAVYAAVLAVGQIAMAVSELEIEHHCRRPEAAHAPRGAWTAWVSAGLTVVVGAAALAGAGTGALWILVLNVPVDWIRLEVARRRAARAAAGRDVSGRSPS